MFLITYNMKQTTIGQITYGDAIFRNVWYWKWASSNKMWYKLQKFIFFKNILLFSLNVFQMLKFCTHCSNDEKTSYVGNVTQKKWLLNIFKQSGCVKLILFCKILHSFTVIPYTIIAEKIYWVSADIFNAQKYYTNSIPIRSGSIK